MTAPSAISPECQSPCRSTQTRCKVFITPPPLDVETDDLLLTCSKLQGNQFDIFRTLEGSSDDPFNPDLAQFFYVVYLYDIVRYVLSIFFLMRILFVFTAIFETMPCLMVCRSALSTHTISAKCVFECVISNNVRS
jgi:hypothetical protein